MSETKDISPKEAELKAIEDVRDLFALAHDLILQASHPGHLAGKITQVQQFLSFQYAAMKQKAEMLRKGLESVVDVPAAKEAVAEALGAPSGHQTQSGDTPNE